MTGESPAPRVRIHEPVVLVAVAAFVGLAGFLVGWLASRNKRLAGIAGDSPTVGGNVTNIWVTGGADAVTAAGEAKMLHATAPALTTPAAVPITTDLPLNGLSSSVNHDTQFSTITIGTSTVLMYTAPGDRNYKIIVRVTSPPGAFAMFSSSSGALTSTPGAGVLTIPVGGWQEVRLRPRQPLYVRGNAAGVMVSYTVAPELL